MAEKKYIIDNPEVECWWDYEKNTIPPMGLTISSGKKVWWKCKDCGVSFVRRIADFRRPYCLKCSHFHREIKESDSFAFNYPYLLTEWNYDKNKVSPYKIKPKSNTYFFWTCTQCGDVFETSPYYRIRSNGGGCKRCKSETLSILKKIPKNGLSFIEKYGEIVEKYYDYSKNSLELSTISYKSNQRAYWRCKSCGASWIAKFQQMAEGRKCPMCEAQRFKSFPEQCIAYYVSYYFKPVIWGCDIFKDKGIAELDIYLPELKIAIEYDGEHWHTDCKRDLKKDDLCEKHGITLFRIREPLCPHYESASVKFYRKNNHQDDNGKDLNFIISKVLMRIDQGISYNVNIQRDASEIYKMSEQMQLDGSFAEKYPRLAQYWDYKMNGHLHPSGVAPSSDRKLFFICESCGKSFHRRIASIIRSKYCECQNCARIRASINRMKARREDSIGVLYPEIAKELLNTQNGDIDIYSLYPGSIKKYWWQCSKCNYLYIMTINNRISGHSCKKCAISRRAVHRSKKIINLDTGEQFDSITYASRIYKVDASCICACCNGRQKTAAGFHWAYLSNE